MGDTRSLGQYDEVSASLRKQGGSTVIILRTHGGYTGIEDWDDIGAI